MKIGLSRPYADPGFPIPDVDMAIVAQIAEECGFQWLTYGHHTVRPLDEPVKPPHYGVPYYQDPLIGATRALALTKTIEISTGVLIMPMQHPVNVAKQVGTLDLYAGGRFALGLGTGGASRLEIEATGGSFERRWDYTMESVQIMKGLWTQDRFEFNGEFFNIPPVCLAPRPARKPHTPIWLGGYGDAVLKRVGQHCNGWLPAYDGLEIYPFLNIPMSGPEHVIYGRKKIEEFAQQAGRVGEKFEMAVILSAESKPEHVKHYEDAGADRLAMTLPEIKSADEARAAIEKLAKQLL